MLEPTHPKNLLVKKMASSSPIFLVKITRYLSCHHLNFLLDASKNPKQPTTWGYVKSLEKLYGKKWDSNLPTKWEKNLPTSSPALSFLESCHPTKALASTPEAPWDPQKKAAAAWEMVSTKGFLPQSRFFVYPP